MKTTTLAMLIVALMAACGDDNVGVPQPVPIPHESLLRGSDSLDVDFLRIVGLPGAVDGEGEVFISDGTIEVSVMSTAAGSFVAGLETRRIVVQVRFETSETITYVVPVSVMMVPPAPFALMETIPITVPVGGKTIISGQAEADATILAVNLASGAVAVGQADAFALFTMELEAASGDSVEVYVDFEPLGEPWELTVP